MQLTDQRLPDSLIEEFGGRAATYDRENQFFTEDFEALRECGYLSMAVPAELGGGGHDLAWVTAEQRRLAYRAPATALATNMHLYWTGVAGDLLKAGDSSLEWLLRESVAGEVFAAGHGESGNDLPLLLSSAKAERVDGGYRLTGRKMFGSLSPVWTRLGIHAMDTGDPAAPKIIHVFMPRDTPGYRIEHTWDTLGMRATQSDDTVLEGAFVPDARVARVLPAGEADLFILAIFAWAETTFASIYLGMADRAIDLAVATAGRRTSLGLTRSMAYHPEVQHLAAEMFMEREAASALVEKTVADWVAGVDHGHNWPAKLITAKHVATQAAARIVDHAMTISGGTGMFRSSELERMYRDVRCGGFHPANPMLAHELVGKTALGVGLGEQPRWG
jgi:alkylation response protein AidB-like acyl-CoA dehydrogenase